MHEILHQLVQEYQLSPAQTRRLWRIAGLHRPAKNMYQHLRTALLLVAALLLGAGLVFWVAANWAAQTRTFKLHLLLGAVDLPLAAALLLPAGRVVLRIALALLGTLALGGLLAYIGITYQTGADAWQLFATWAALALPLIVVMRSDWLWALWLLIVTTAIGSWSGQSLINHLDVLAQWPQLGGAFTLVAGICVAAGDRALGAGAQYAGGGCKTSLQLASGRFGRFGRLGDVWRFLRFGQLARNRVFCMDQPWFCIQHSICAFGRLGGLAFAMA